MYVDVSVFLLIEDSERTFSRHQGGIWSKPTRANLSRSIVLLQQAIAQRAANFCLFDLSTPAGEAAGLVFLAVLEYPC